MTPADYIGWIVVFSNFINVIRREYLAELFLFYLSDKKIYGNNKINQFSNIKSVGYGSVSLDGFPDLPMFSTLYQLPYGKSIQVEYSVIESHIIEIWFLIKK